MNKRKNVCMKRFPFPLPFIVLLFTQNFLCLDTGDFFLSFPLLDFLFLSLYLGLPLNLFSITYRSLHYKKTGLQQHVYDNVHGLHVVIDQVHVIKRLEDKTTCDHTLLKIQHTATCIARCRICYDNVRMHVVKDSLQQRAFAHC